MLIWLFVGFFCIILIFLIFYTFKIYKLRNKENDKKNIKKDLEEFKKAFQNNPDKKVLIKHLNITEYFNIFPFMSEFKEIKKLYSNEDLIKSLRHTQDSFYKFWANKEFDLFIIFEKLTKEKLIIFSSEVVIKIYMEFSIEIFNLFKNTFIQEIIPATICKFENKNYKKLKPNMINDFIDEQFMEFCKRMDKIIQIIQSELYGKQNEKYSETQNNFNDDNEQKISKAYKTLEVLPLDSDDKIKKAYLKLAKTYHPDKNNTEYAKQKMVEINNAYDIVQKDRKKD
ncbi:J domain-containing protein [Spiroplasma floricola]|uniref:J domain-containing protein n=1 Tax=Spiroplasma floricola 23-6 TaxID=1336749 RepID=A0A2K8SD38_9MOLU|nr:J domain-containing protein [Spiroplasma floricola]AUB31343.1 hypothetical protein SFLOR_v1c02860 [Spiroplasma floricola 23-6]